MYISRQATTATVEVFYGNKITAAFAVFGDDKMTLSKANPKVLLLSL